MTTRPMLSVRHETEVKVICRQKFVNFGGEDAVCRNGDLIGVPGQPNCIKTGEN